MSPGSGKEDAEKWPRPIWDLRFSLTLALTKFIREDLIFIGWRSFSGNRYSFSYKTTTIKNDLIDEYNLGSTKIGDPLVAVKGKIFEPPAEFPDRLSPPATS